MLAGQRGTASPTIEEIELLMKVIEKGIGKKASKQCEELTRERDEALQARERDVAEETRQARTVYKFRASISTVDKRASSLGTKEKVFCKGNF